jgi:prephenate dehydrogenase
VAGTEAAAGVAPAGEAAPGASAEPAGGAEMARRANVIGLGLIGGSVALALSARGWTVSGEDQDPARVDAARRRGVIRTSGLDPEATVTFVATPVSSIPDAVRRALAGTTGVVSDVGSVKGPIAAAVADPRFCAGHPMAGSELDGLDGADAALFEGAVWVLTPTAETADTTFAAVARIVSDLGAEVVALPPDRHDTLVAVVSHVPHLTAAALMTVADQRAEEHAALLRLAAGGFRDMTRIAAGQPDLWLDICAENRTAIVDALDALVERLGRMRRTVAADDRDVLLADLTRARDARINLPGRVARSAEMAEVRTVIPDRPGAAAEVFTLAAELGVNVTDFEVYHSAEGERGVLILLIEAAQGDLFRGGLIARGFRPSVRRLG